MRPLKQLNQLNAKYQYCLYLIYPVYDSVIRALRLHSLGLCDLILYTDIHNG